MAEDDVDGDGEKILYYMGVRVDPKCLDELDKYERLVKDRYNKIAKSAGEFAKYHQQNEAERHKSALESQEREKRVIEQRVKGLEQLKGGLEWATRSMVLLGIATTDQEKKFLKMGAAAESAFGGIRSASGLLQGMANLSGLKLGQGALGATYTFKTLGTALYKAGPAFGFDSAAAATSAATAPVAAIAAAVMGSIAAAISGAQTIGDARSINRATGKARGFGGGGAAVGSWRDKVGMMTATTGLGELGGFADWGTMSRLRGGDDLSGRIIDQMGGNGRNSVMPWNNALAMDSQERIRQISLRPRGAMGDLATAQGELQAMMQGNATHLENAPGPRPKEGKKASSWWDSFTGAFASGTMVKEHEEKRYSALHSDNELLAKRKEIVALAEKEADALRDTVTVRREELQISKAIANEARGRKDEVGLRLGLGTRGQQQRLDRLYQKAMNDPAHVSAHIFNEVIEKVASPADAEFMLSERRKKGIDGGGFSVQRNLNNVGAAFGQSGKDASRVGDSTTQLTEVLKVIQATNTAIQQASMDTEMRGLIKAACKKFLNKGDEGPNEGAEGKVGLIQNSQRRALLS